MKGKKGFEPGISGNPEGRPPGATNKIGRTVKERIADFLNDKILELPEIWNKLNARDKAALIKDLLPFFLARLQAQSIDLKTDLSSLTEDQLIFICNELFKRENDEGKK